jgi:hypothetical protein
MCIAMIQDERLFEKSSYFGVILKDGRQWDEYEEQN